MKLVDIPRSSPVVYSESYRTIALYDGRIGINMRMETWVSFRTESAIPRLPHRFPRFAIQSYLALTEHGA